MTWMAGEALLQQIQAIMKDPALLHRMAQKIRDEDFLSVVEWANARFPGLGDESIFDNGGELLRLKQVEEKCKPCSGLEKCQEIDKGVRMMGNLTIEGSFHSSTGYCDYKLADRKRRGVDKPATGNESGAPRSNKYYKGLQRVSG